MNQNHRVSQKSRRFAWRAIQYANFLQDRLVARRIKPERTVVITGFWRSGTTWLQQSLAQILDAKTVFEPLSPTVPEWARIYSHWPVAQTGTAVPEFFMPYWAVKDQVNAKPPHDDFPDFIEHALRGDLNSWWTRRARRPYSSWRSGVVLKFIRGHLCIRAIHNHFGCPIIHLTRDPRAVLASIKMTQWGERVFKTFSLQQQLLDQPDGRADFFGPWRTLILKYDQRDMLSRIAAYWALSEIFIRHSFADRPPRFCLLSYEELVRRPQLIMDTIETLGVDYPYRKNPSSMDEDSLTTDDHRRRISIENRIFGWRKNLSDNEIGMIGEVVAEFGLVDCLVDQ